MLHGFGIGASGSGQRIASGAEAGERRQKSLRNDDVGDGVASNVANAAVAHAIGCRERDFGIRSGAGLSVAKTQEHGSGEFYLGNEDVFCVVAGEEVGQRSPGESVITVGGDLRGGGGGIGIEKIVC